ncbi:class I SAM-dependent methyltransferase [Aminobacter aminovorans]|uniref:Methyltransferase protein n=1 Tax=Aminobacter aminovorans TaxID=83263 RepID=A0AAC9ATI6_AMIAI|nr:methyltransferase domain-containing protein [Aminobacter aminovorans]AMS45044.1 Methyltransferase protein [Aminobacter aminovorans]MBB3710046.1 SAM-dependent methyltransferase [Aminobacter aminovorans]
MEQTYSTWHLNPTGEAVMEDIHTPYWRHFINVILERNLSDCTVLDFGCSRGGFLRLLNGMLPFCKGVGIDIASDSIDEAGKSVGDQPLSYHVTGDPSRFGSMFDIAFSYEVIYLLQDLSEHARQMKEALRENGVYYAVTGCHTESPLWNRRKEVIANSSSTRVPSYSPDDYIDAFAANGFDVTLRRFGFNDFAPPPTNRKFHPGILDALTYSADEKILFRFSKN